MHADRRPVPPRPPRQRLDDLLTRALPRARSHRTWIPGERPPAGAVHHTRRPAPLEDARWPSSLVAGTCSSPAPSCGVRTVGTPRSPSPAPWSARRSPVTGRLRPALLHASVRHSGHHRAGRADLRDAGRPTPLHPHVDRGLDHGAFIPLVATGARCPSERLPQPRRHWRGPRDRSSRPPAFSGERRATGVFAPPVSSSRWSRQRRPGQSGS